MDADVSELLDSEVAAARELDACLAYPGRTPIFILAGPREARLQRILQTITIGRNGCYYDLADPEVYRRFVDGPPLHGRDVSPALACAALRQFVSSEVAGCGNRMLAIRVPATIWKTVASAHPAALEHCLSALRQWTAPCAVVLSFPLGADQSLMTLDKLRQVLAHHLISFTLSSAELRFLKEQ